MLGNLVRAKNDACAVVFVRDALGRVIEERVGEHVIESRYNASGRRIRRATNLGHETFYDFDGNGGLLGVTFGVDPRWMDFSPESLATGGPVRAPWKATFARDALGNEVERQLPGGVVARWDRDSFGRPQAHRVRRGDERVQDIDYRWRSYEQLAELIDAENGPTRLQHDARSYLVAASRPNGTIEYRAPDAVGNIYRDSERTDRRYGKGCRLEEFAGAQYTHNEDGQLLEKKAPDGSRWRYAWDQDGQLQAVTRSDGQKATFAYDALGRRVKKTFAGKTTTYIWDGDDLVHEVIENAALVTWVFEPGTFAPLAKVEGEARYGIVTDHLGTPQVLFDEAGVLAWKAQLDLYGVARTDTKRTSCLLRWPGQYEDEETGLYYNRFRYYDPESGRYISQDPIRLLGGLISYGYADDPVSWTDPLGLVACDKLTRQTRALTAQEILDHVFDRHATDFLGIAAKKSSDLQAFTNILDKLRRSGLTFKYNLGGTPVLGHLARYEGRYAAIFFFDGGVHAGEVASAFYPRPKQLSTIFSIVSRKGP
ncbi:MAG: RHS domain-containing protein [Polyangiaceae bacterium]|nr:RHS domain-containing protein [Polyangiaceae bacterium]